MRYIMKMKRSPEARTGSTRGAAGAFIDGLRQRGRVSFALAELAHKTGLSPIAARRQLARLGARVVRVAPRQEFFLIVEPEHRALGAPPPAWWLDSYFRWLEHPYYLALQSAAAAYGATAQAIQQTQVMTDRPRREIRLGRLRVRFFVKRALRSTPTQALAQAQAPLLLSTPAATVVDLVCYAPRIGGIERAAETILPLLPRLKRVGLVSVLTPDVEGPTVQRLGYLLERLEHPGLAAGLRKRLPPSMRPVPLDLGRPAQAEAGIVDDLGERWGVVVNASIEVRP